MEHQRRPDCRQPRRACDGVHLAIVIISIITMPLIATNPLRHEHRINGNMPPF